MLGTRSNERKIAGFRETTIICRIRENQTLNRSEKPEGRPIKGKEQREIINRNQHKNERTIRIRNKEV